MQFLPVSNQIACAAGVLVLAALVGCSGPQPADAEPIQQCQDPRPQMCTLEYAPVCAILGNKERREYSNGCSACSDPEVTGYIPGPCAESGS
jgi:hypothetical protein